MMAMYINQCPFFVPIERLSEGNYFLGAKKIFAKIMNNKLIIRVGGGFCVIDEFMKQLEQDLRSSGQLYIYEDDGSQITYGDAIRGGSPIRSN